MQHELVFKLAVQGINQLCFTGAAQCGNTDCLGFTTGEDGRTVNIRYGTGFNGDWTHSAVVTTIDTWLATQDALTHDLFFQLGEGRNDVAIGKLGSFTAELLNGIILQRAYSSVTLLFVGNTVGFADFVCISFGNYIDQRLVGFGWCPMTR